ncbi:DMT family transporter [Paenibacillus tianjinensis]|uniref:DMT family transporter n=1 Tax=Paenibacillus tianjinensis TaxID=2810347 RepID=UPI0022B6247A|nr:multidrug efflux SMR transporter [Paenibacillus tianjinensis]
MNPFVWLAIAIVSEVCGSSLLKLSNGFKRLFPSLGVLAGLGSAFYFLSLALQSISLGTAYAIWSGVGTALTAMVGVFVYKERMNIKKILGLLLIIGGVITLKLASGGTH